MKETIIISKDERERYKLKNIFDFIGAKPIFAADLNEAFSILERTPARAIFISENIEIPINIAIKEFKRMIPLMPVFILLKNTDHNTAIEYMKLGAFDCAQYPWTPEEIAPMYKKSISLIKTEISFKPKKDYKKITIAIFSALLMLLSFISYYYKKKSNLEAMKLKEKISETTIAGKNIAGFFFDKNNIYISHWDLQTIYRYSLSEFKLISAEKIPNFIMQNIVDFKTYFSIIRDDNIIENRLKDDKFTLISKIGPINDISEVCFDGMYIWSINKDKTTLSKRINNQNWEILQNFELKQKDFGAFNCDEKYFYYYNKNNGEIELYSLKDPEKMIGEIKNQEKIIAISSYENNLFLAVDKGEITALKKIKIEDITRP